MTQSDIDAAYRDWYLRTWPHHILASPTPVYRKHELLTVDMISREAVRLFRNSQHFLRTGSQIYGESLDDFSRRILARDIGSQLRIRLPNDYR